MKRMIRITGKGKISARPDMVRVLITLENMNMDYEAALEESAENKNAVNEIMEEAGFSGTDLKTISFDVYPEHEGYEAEDKSWKQRLVGYRVSHEMKLEFAEDRELLGKVLSALSTCPGNPEFSIEFFVEDVDFLRNELLRKAVEDAKEKAEILTGASGVSLGSILKIDYFWQEVELVSRPYAKISTQMIGSSMDMDVTPEDIKLTDTVTVEWEIA